MHINTLGSQQHLTNLANYLWGHFYRAFLLLRRRGSRERERDLMKGYGHREPAPIYIYYECFAFPRVPWRKHLLASHNPHNSPLSTPHLPFFHPSITASPWPRPPRIAPQAGVLRQAAESARSPQSGRSSKRGELTRRPDRVQARGGEDLEARCWESLWRG